MTILSFRARPIGRRGIPRCLPEISFYKRYFATAQYDTSIDLFLDNELRFLTYVRNDISLGGDSSLRLRYVQNDIYFGNGILRGYTPLNDMKKQPRTGI